jgi:hypothetical protein
MTPIKPENRKLYPSNWKAIRAEILERATCLGVPRCEWCNVKNHTNIVREKGGHYYYIPDESHAELRAQGIGISVRIVLTIAHLNHNPRDNRRRNLAALCQKCHNGHDVEHRNKNRARTNAAKAGK